MNDYPEKIGRFEGTELKVDLRDCCVHLLKEIGPDEFIEYMGIAEPLLAWAREQLTEAYSGTHYDPYIHKEREQFINQVKSRTIEFKSNELADKISGLESQYSALVKMYHWCIDQGLDHRWPFPNSHDEIGSKGWDECREYWRQTVRKIVENTVSQSCGGKFDA